MSVRNSREDFVVNEETIMPALFDACLIALQMTLLRLPPTVHCATLQELPLASMGLMAS